MIASEGEKPGQVFAPSGLTTDRSGNLFVGDGNGRVQMRMPEGAWSVIAAKGENRERLVSELADLVFHLSVLMVDAGIAWADVEGELGRRSAPE